LAIFFGAFPTCRVRLTTSRTLSQAKVNELARQMPVGVLVKTTPHTVGGIEAREYPVHHHLGHGDLAAHRFAAAPSK